MFSKVISLRGIESRQYESSQLNQMALSKDTTHKLKQEVYVKPLLNDKHEFGLDQIERVSL